MLDLENFTPWSAFGGGLLIGLSAALLFLASGRIAGISGILGAFLDRQKNNHGWRVAFLSGLMLAPLLWVQIVPEGLPAFRLQVDTPQGWALIVVAGLLVGFGTQLANGCTSGHGICGLARFSVRSTAAVLTFMGSGIATVYVLRHLIGG